jgi:hypothetical protein
MVDGIERDVVNVDFLLLGLAGGLKFAVDGDVGILVETGVAFKTGFGLGAAYTNGEVVLEETEFPFESGTGGAVFEGMSYTLGGFDEFAIGYASGRPMGREMVGIELEETVSEAGHTADDDMLAALAAYFEIVHRSPEEIDIGNGSEIAHSTRRASGNSRRRNVGSNEVLQTGHYDIFQMA